MIDTLYILTVLVLHIVGFLGCVLPVFPGPASSYAAILVLLPSRFAPSSSFCVVMGLLCALVLFLDFIVPAFGAKKFKCSGLGITGCVVGTVVGMFFGIMGLLLGPFLGAVLGEIIAGKNFRSSVCGGFGAFLGFVFGVLIKVVYCAVCLGWCVYRFWEVLFR